MERKEAIDWIFKIGFLCAMIASPFLLLNTLGSIQALENRLGGNYDGTVIASYTCVQNPNTIFAYTDYCIEIAINGTLFYGQLTCDVFPVNSHPTMEYYPNRDSTYDYQFLDLPYGCSQEPPLP